MWLELQQRVKNEHSCSHPASLASSLLFNAGKAELFTIRRYKSKLGVRHLHLSATIYITQATLTIGVNRGQANGKGCAGITIWRKLTLHLGIAKTVPRMHNHIFVIGQDREDIVVIAAIVRTDGARIFNLQPSPDDRICCAHDLIKYSGSKARYLEGEAGIGRLDI